VTIAAFDRPGCYGEDKKVSRGERLAHQELRHDTIGSLNAGYAGFQLRRRVKKTRCLPTNFPCLCTNFPAEVSENSLLRCIGNSRIRSLFRKVFFALSEANFRTNDEKLSALSRLSGNFARLPFQEPSTIYARVGASLTFEPSTGAGERGGERPALEEDDLITYRKLARREDPFGLRARSQP
jgi:hypothetical protein